MKEVELITISLIAPPAALPADGAFAGGECVNFGPEGLVFGSKVDLMLPYFDNDGDGLLDGTNSIELQIGVKHFNRSSGNWETVEVVDRQADLNLAHVASSHLSPYIPYGSCNGLPLQPDQVNDVAPKYDVGFGAPPGGLGSLFQSFTPRASALAAIDIGMNTGGDFPSLGYETTVNVRSDSPNGPLLGTATVLVPGPQSVGAQLEVRFDFSPVIPLSPGNPYLIEWISPFEGGRTLTWMTADRDSYSGGTAFGCAGIAILGDDLIFKTYAVEPLPAEKETAYFELMTDLKIDAATKLAEDEKEILTHLIRQLEYQATYDWEELHRPEVSSVSIDELKLIRLRRLAVAFYHEVNDSFLWKIVDYSQSALNVLLGFTILNGNPSFLDPANRGSDFANIAPDR